MASSQSEPGGRELEELSEQLRALARHLVRDPSSADDVVQEAWLAALDRPRFAVRELGAWLRVVVRNLAARRARRDALRQNAEQRVAPSESADETEQLLERSNVALALRRAVYELPEHVRSVIVLHYFESRTLEATAERLRRPLETVRSQRRRGIEELRAILDRRHRGARRDWLATLAPLLWVSRERSPKWRFAALAGLVSVAFVAIVGWLAWPAPSSEPSDARGAALVLDTPPQAELVLPLDAPARVAVLPPELATVPVPPVEAPLQPQVATKRFVCTVTDASGQALEGAWVDALGLDGIRLGPFTTDAAGRAEFDLRVDQLSFRASFAERGGVLLHAMARGRAKSMAAFVPAAEGGSEQRVELQIGGPGQALRGVVVDPGGAPLAGAHVEVAHEIKHITRKPNGVALVEDSRAAVTDAEGRFAIEFLPRRTHRWVARAQGFGVATGAAEGDGEELEVTLTLPLGRELAGRVRTSTGVPAAEAEVWVARGRGASTGAARVRADAEGRYRLTGISESPLRLFARAGAPDNEFADALFAFQSGDEQGELDFELSARPLLEFRFVEADGRACAQGMTVLDTGTGQAAPWRQSVTTDADGRALFADYPLGPLVLQFVPANGAGSVLRRDIDARTMLKLELRLGEFGATSTAPLRVALVDPWHSPIKATVVAVATSDGSTILGTVRPESGVLDDLMLPAGERHFFAADEHGVTSLGTAELDGVTALDLGVHTLGPTRAIDVEWPLQGGEDLMWVLGGELTGTEGSTRMLEFAHGRTRFELRDGRYTLGGRTPMGDERLIVGFTVGAGHPTRVVVR